MSNKNQMDNITGIIKLLGERIIKIEKTLLYYNKHIKNTHQLLDPNSLENMETRLTNLERKENSTKTLGTIADLKKRVVSLERTNKNKKDENKILEEQRRHLVNYINEERSKIEESQYKLTKNVELLESSIKAFEKKIKSRKL